MSDNSPRLDLPLLQPSQAQKHVTHNEALRILDIFVQLTVEEFDASNPPANPVEGLVYAVGPGGTGDWFGANGRLATWVDGAWQFHTPTAGWIAAHAASSEVRVFTGSVWSAVTGGGAASTQNLAGVGVNTTSDLTNRLNVSAPATLLSHEGAGHQLKVNKASAADTASLLFQSGFSGRAELGLAGDNDFSLKLSADGSAWVDALKLSPGQSVLTTDSMVGSVSATPGAGSAAFETGSNANGRYTRFADGTQICWKNDFTAAGSSGGVWTFPAPFADANAAVTATPLGEFARFISLLHVTATGATLNGYSQPGGTELPDTSLMAIGRWS
ncbi:MAG: hypothetical protein CSA74_07260 [Rhodobacterales bacterium]|nr:MAG: hypothetical protein CSA74_07260 [Rhodobacterales bacterium]